MWSIFYFWYFGIDTLSKALDWSTKDRFRNNPAELASWSAQFGIQSLATWIRSLCPSGLMNSVPCSTVGTFFTMVSVLLSELIGECFCRRHSGSRNFCGFSLSWTFSKVISLNLSSNGHLQCKCLCQLSKAILGYHWHLRRCVKTSSFVGLCLTSLESYRDHFWLFWKFEQCGYRRYFIWALTLIKLPEIPICVLTNWSTYASSRIVNVSCIFEVTQCHGFWHFSLSFYVMAIDPLPVARTSSISI